ncbi:MAG TPA: alcohol dehydrogenase catalytic domain-containing protein [Candidatus Dormibacteraeota bacterium]
MRAVTFQDVGKLSLEDVPKPTLQEPTDALLRVTKSAICGSDLHVLNGRIPGMMPGGVLGHEFVGVIEEVGPDVRKVEPGDRALASMTIPDGACWYCQRGMYSRCPDNVVFGYGVYLGDLNGGQAEYVRVPRADLGLHRLDASLSDEQALFAGDIFSAGYDCAVEGRIQPGDSVVVQGCGPVGLFAIQAAQTFKPGQLFAVDTVEQRLELAQSFGATAVNAKHVHVPTFVQDHTGGRGADVVLECVGALPAFDQAIDLVRAGGRVSVIGVYSEPEHAIPISTIFVKAVDVKFCGTANVLGHWDSVLELVRSGQADPTAIISHRMNLSDALVGYELFAAREAMKVVLTP